MNKLTQKFLDDEAKKYTYFPEINKYDLIFKNYYVINNNSNIYNKTENNNNSNFFSGIQESNLNQKCETLTNIPINKIKKENINKEYFAAVNKEKSNDKIIPNNKKLSNKNFNINNNYYTSIMKKKLSLLNKLEKGKGKEKIKNKSFSKVVNNKNSNSKKNNIKKNNSKNIIKIKSTKSHNGQENNNNKTINPKIKEINYNNLISFYPSPNLQKQYKDIKNNSPQHTELNDEITKNSYNVHSSEKNHNKQFILTPLSYRYIQKIGLPTTISVDNHYQSKIISNSYKFLPKNQISLYLEGKKNKNINSNSSKKDIIYNANNYTIGQNLINSKKINSKIFNSIGLVDNSLSTNFVDNEINTLRSNDNNQQYSVIYNKLYKNTNYSIPSNENNINYNNISNNNINENMENKIYHKKINNYHKISKTKPKDTFNRVISDNNLDNMISNTVNTDSSSIKPKIIVNENNTEKMDDFNIINELMDQKLNNFDNLKIMSGAVNENVKNKRNKHENKPSMDRESEPITMQSMSDSKILEIANYYLNEEETVDKIAIDDILLTKNSKGNCKLKEKNSI